MSLWRDIADSLNDAIIALSPSLEPLGLNPAAETILGVSNLTPAGVRALMAANEWLKRMVDACLGTGQNLGNPENTLVLGRRSIAVRAEVSPLFGDKGEPGGAVVLISDLSHLKSAEPTFDSEEPVLRLSPAGLAHEVKNPLTGIKGAAELLRAMTPSDPRAQQYCGVILDGVNRITALVEQVLAVSNPQRLRQEPVNIHQVLHHALRMAGAFPDPPPGITIEQRFDPSLPEVSGDAVALERVFLNLVRNALEAIEGETAAGQWNASAAPAVSSPSAQPPARKHVIRLTTAMETQFRLSSHGRRRQFLRVEISDTGKGMTERELKQLFMPFFTTKPSGTGLGLVLSQRIVALHGGKLWAERNGAGAARNSRGLLRGVDYPPDSSPARDGSAAEADATGPAPSGMSFNVLLPVARGPSS